MRLALVAVLFPLLTGLGSAPSHEDIPPHSPSVLHAYHTPTQPERGQDVRVSLGVTTTANVSAVKVVYCRVERYACAPALTAHKEDDRTYNATIPWHASFFRNVAKVGYQFEIRHANGTMEVSPRAHHPARPANLPEGGGVYYYYSLPTDAPAIAAGLALVAVAALAWAGSRRP